MFNYYNYDMAAVNLRADLYIPLAIIRLIQCTPDFAQRHSYEVIHKIRHW